MYLSIEDTLCPSSYLNNDAALSHYLTFVSCLVFSYQPHLIVPLGRLLEIHQGVHLAFLLGTVSKKHILALLVQGVKEVTPSMRSPLYLSSPKRMKMPQQSHRQMSLPNAGEANPYQTYESVVGSFLNSISKRAKRQTMNHQTNALNSPGVKRGNHSAKGPPRNFSIDLISIILLQTFRVR